MVSMTEVVTSVCVTLLIPGSLNEVDAACLTGWNVDIGKVCDRCFGSSKLDMG